MLASHPVPARAATETFPIAIGDTIAPDVPSAGAGRIESFDASDAYTFSGTVGQRILFDVLAVDGGCGPPTGDLQWELRLPNGGVTARGLLRSCTDDDQVFFLQETNTYTLVTSTNFSSGTYSFKLAAPPLDNFDVAIGDTVAPDVPGAGAGRIESLGAADGYTFSGAAGQRIVFDVLAVDGGCGPPTGDLRWSLASSNDPFYATGLLRSCSEDDQVIVLPETGTYNIGVGTDHSPGTYSFKLVAVTPETFPIALGDTVAPDVPGPGAGRIEGLGAEDDYTFSASAGQRFFFDTLQLNGSCEDPAPGEALSWELKRPNGEVLLRGSLLSCSFDLAMHTEEEGTYTFSVSTDRSPGTYSFKLSALPRETYGISIGDSVSPNMPSPGAGRIEAQDGQDVYTFSAASGQRVYFDVLAVNGGCDAPINLSWELRRPDGNSFLASGSLRSCSDDDQLIELPGAGDYMLIVTANYFAGDYSFKLAPLPTENFDIAIGDTVGPDVPAAGAGRIETPFAQDVYRFNAVAGQRLVLDLLEVDGSCSGPEGPLRWRLKLPNGADLTPGFSNFMRTCSDDEVTQPLPVDGTYSLVVDAGSQPATGTYKIGLSLRTDPSAETFPIAIGDTVGPDVPSPGAGRIEGSDTTDVYTFTTTTDRLFLDVLEVDGGCDGPAGPLRWRMEQDGNSDFQTGGALSLCSDDTVIVLPGPGSYKLTVEAQPGGPPTGTYGFNLGIAPDDRFQIATGTTVTPGSLGPGSGSIESPYARDIYEFQATAGDRIFFDITEVNGGCDGPPGSLQWSITPPHPANIGSGLIANCSYQDGGPIVLPETGTYTITIDVAFGSPPGSTGTYGFRLLNAPAPEPFTTQVGDSVGPDSPGPGAGRIDSPGEEDVYTFTALAGERISINVLDVNGGCSSQGPFQWEINMPGPPFSASGPLYCGYFGPIVLAAERGVYTLAVHAPSGDASTGTYRLQIVPVPTASFTLTPDPPVAGQTVNFDASGSSDLRGSIVKYEWDLDGDGTYETVSAGPTTSRSYPGGTGTPLPPVLVRLRVTNDAGGSDVTLRSLSFSNAPAQAVGTSVAAAALPAPALGQSANLARVSGSVLVKRPGSGQFVRVSAATQIPVRSIVDTTKGKAELTTAADAKGRTQSVKVYQGIFVISQNAKTALTDLRLTGSSFATCPSGNARRSAASKSRRKKRSREATIRKLWSDGSGKFQSTGRYSSAAVRGTIWLVADRCDGTLTKVRRGTVTVRDFVRKRTVILKAPKSYLANRSR